MSFAAISREMVGQQVLRFHRILFQTPDNSILAGLMRLEPKNVELIGSELAIQWTDEAESYLQLEFLRRACPCAACGGEPDVLGNVIHPGVSYTPESFALQSWELVGGYALQPRWGDGHRTGIYSYQYLRRLGAAGLT